MAFNIKTFSLSVDFEQISVLMEYWSFLPQFQVDFEVLKKLLDHVLAAKHPGMFFFIVLYAFLTPPPLPGVPLVRFHVCPLTH